MIICVNRKKKTMNYFGGIRFFRAYNEVFGEIKINASQIFPFDFELRNAWELKRN